MTAVFFRVFLGRFVIFAPIALAAYIDANALVGVFILAACYFILSFMVDKSATDKRFYVPGGFYLIKKLMEWLWNGFEPKGR